MPIVRPPAPFSATIALFQGLPAFLPADPREPNPAVVKQTFVGSRPKFPTADELGIKVGVIPTRIPDYSPLRVSSLPMAPVIGGKGIEASAVSVGWRYFVSETPASTIVAMAAVSQRPPTHAWKMAATFFGPNVAALRDASKDLRSYESSDINYELSYLTVPSMNVEAFYLKPADGSSAVLVPFPNYTSQIVPGLNNSRSYTEAQFLTTLISLVKKARNRIPYSGG
jgi:hypothetical protein